MSVVLFRLAVTALALLVLLDRGVSVSIVSFSVAVDVQDVGGAQRPLKHFVCRVAACGRMSVLVAARLLGARSCQLVLNGLSSADVRGGAAVLLFL